MMPFLALAKKVAFQVRNRLCQVETAMDVGITFLEQDHLLPQSL